MAYPTELTTSLWLDHILSLTTRDEQIAALATLHRRLAHEAKVAVLLNLETPIADDRDPDEARKVNEAVRKVTESAREKLPVPEDYKENGEPREGALR